MAVLARASRAEIEALAGPELPAHEIMKAPETGTVMVEGRAGGAGRRFNLGEATMTRCIVRLSTGTLGFAYGLGRDGRKARLAAILDARLQREGDGELRQGVSRLAEAQAAARDLASRKAAATKVDFFTLVRGA
jgi:alpha-D-ribose 1-methylphosphonate 5-triphosphate synthase subunit PhnG